MRPLVYESGNRRAVVTGDRVSLHRITGNVRRSVSPVWPATQVASPRSANRIAKQWAYRGKISKAIH